MMGLSSRATMWLSVGVVLAAAVGAAQLSPRYYDTTCPKLQRMVRVVMKQVVGKEPRMGASIIRLFFHDCFVNGCDASVLLDDVPARGFVGEKNAFPNANSLRGYEVIDDIKARVESSCRAVVSCADILALAGRDAVQLLGGPRWKVALGRRDARTTNLTAANSNLPRPDADVATLLHMFGNKGLDARDLTALSGAHTVGRARCVNFRQHIYDDPSSVVDASFAASLRAICPPLAGDGDDNLAPLDARAPDAFDNGYFDDLLARRVLLESDQALYDGSGGVTDKLVRAYAANQTVFFRDFVAAMVKMGNLTNPLAGTNDVEVRLNCRLVNN